MSKLLFLVHGMGSNPAHWSDSLRDKLDEVASRYSAFAGGAAKFSQRVTLCEIRYDGVFEEKVQQWQADAAELDKWSQTAGRPLPKIVQWLRTTMPREDAKNFFWSTAVDPLLYRGFQLVRDEVRANVMAQIVSCLTTNMAGGAADACVLSHSLGTAVMHDALHQLGSQPYQGNESFIATRFKFQSFFMLADVCMLGPHGLLDIDYFNSVVRPVIAGNERTYCQFFFNAWHQFDPFVLSGPFRPTTWGDRYREIGPLQHFHQANIHGLVHYLDHPAVHVPIINASLGFQAIPVKESQDALANYPLIGSPECSAQIQKLKELAKEFENAGEDLEELVIKIAEFYAAAKQLGEECKGMAGSALIA